jgi:hypothetical protein
LLVWWVGIESGEFWLVAERPNGSRTVFTLDRQAVFDERNAVEDFKPKLSPSPAQSSLPTPRAHDAWSTTSEAVCCTDILLQSLEDCCKESKDSNEECDFGRYVCPFAAGTLNGLRRSNTAIASMAFLEKKCRKDKRSHVGY